MNNTEQLGSIAAEIEHCLEIAKACLEAHDFEAFKVQQSTAFEVYVSWVKVAFHGVGDLRLKPLIDTFQALKKEYRAVHGYGLKHYM